DAVGPASVVSDLQKGADDEGGHAVEKVVRRQSDEQKIRPGFRDGDVQDLFDGSFLLPDAAEVPEIMLPNEKCRALLHGGTGRGREDVRGKCRGKWIADGCGADPVLIGARPGV